MPFKSLSPPINTITVPFASEKENKNKIVKIAVVREEK